MLPPTAGSEALGREPRILVRAFCTSARDTNRLVAFARTPCGATQYGDVLDPIEATKRLVDAFEQGDVATTERLIGPERVRRLREEYRWTVDDYITKDWHPVLATMTGPPVGSSMPSGIRSSQPSRSPMQAARSGSPM